MNLLVDQFVYALPQGVCKISYEYIACKQTSSVIWLRMCGLLWVPIRGVCHWSPLCKMYVLTTCSTIISLTIPSVILTMRTWAACGGGERLRYGLFGMLCISIVSILPLNAHYLRSSTCRYFYSAYRDFNIERFGTDTFNSWRIAFSSVNWMY